jgi:flagellar basal-body rod protein FlgF
MTAAGYEVLDVNNQPITTAGRGKITLDGSGNLLSNGQKIAQLKVVQADTKSLSKEGDNLFTANIPTALQAMQRPMVRPGTLEQSNMSPVQGMVQMLVVSRSFEMAQRALTTQDELLRQAATELGKV